MSHPDDVSIAGFARPTAANSHDPYRRIFLVVASSGEDPLTERSAAAQPWRREMAFMPEAADRISAKPRPRSLRYRRRAITTAGRALRAFPRRQEILFAGAHDMHLLR